MNSDTSKLTMMRKKRKTKTNKRLCILKTRNIIAFFKTEIFYSFSFRYAIFCLGYSSHFAISFFIILAAKMAKSKNHTNHNQTTKHHRNPTRKPSTKQKIKMKGMDPKFLKNLKFAKKHNKNKFQLAKCAAAK